MVVSLVIATIQISLHSVTVTTSAIAMLRLEQLRAVITVVDLPLIVEHVHLDLDLDC